MSTGRHSDASTPLEEALSKTPSLSTYRPQFQKEHALYIDKFIISLYRRPGATWTSSDTCRLFLPKQRQTPVAVASTASYGISQDMVDTAQSVFRSSLQSANLESGLPTATTENPIGMDKDFAETIPVTPSSAAPAPAKSCVTVPPSASATTDINYTRRTLYSARTSLLVPRPKTLIFEITGVLLRSPMSELVKYAKEIGLPPLALVFFFAASDTFHELQTGKITPEAAFSGLNKEFREKLPEVLRKAALFHWAARPGGRVHTANQDIPLVKDISSDTAGVAEPRYVIEENALKKSMDMFDAQKSLQRMIKATTVRPRVSALLCRLRSAGYKLIGVTNSIDSELLFPKYSAATGTTTLTPKATSASAAATGVSTSPLSSLASLFDHVFYSHACGFRKPNPMFYAHILTSLSLVPHDCLAIESLPQDAHAACSVGLNVLVCRRTSDDEAGEGFISDLCAVLGIDE